MICKMCGYYEASGNGELCDKCLKESIEDTIKINNWIADGHPRHCACRLVWGDGECECRRQQNWLTPKSTTASSKDIVNFDCPELHDYDKEEALLALHAFINDPNKKFKVVCDKTNNSDQDAKEKKFNVDIYIKPDRIFYETKDEGENENG